MSLIIVIQRGQGPNVVKKIQKCIKNAKNMQESIIRSQGKNLIWMIHTFNESDNSHSKGTGAKYSEKKIQKCIKNVKNM